MKKIDFHIHTVPTVWDADFSFELSVLERYVSEAALDAIAITNHNTFDRTQFDGIVASLNIPVFPGIEVTLDCGHILVVANIANLDSFEGQANQITAKITQPEDSISIDELTDLFSNLDEHLVIPHYGKKPAIKGDELDRIREFVSCGEVDSAKKFIRAIKDDTKLIPVLFSDARVSKELSPIPTRQTFVDCGELTLGAIKECLYDMGKVALSENDGNKLFQIFENGQKLSTGLNILLGERSSGKTFTLNKINKLHKNAKYIKQFSLVQQDDASDELEFSSNLQRTQSQIAEDYLSGFKVVINDVMNVDLQTDDQAVEYYVTSLINSAEEADKTDSFSKTALFNESEFPISDDNTLATLIDAVRHVIENVEYRVLIEKHIDISSLKRLAVELIELIRVKKLESGKKKLVNGLVRDIKQRLQIRTSAVQVQDVDLYRVMINKRKVERFTEIVKGLQEKAIISDDHIQDFRVVATKSPFSGAGEIKDRSGVRTAFRDAFDNYYEPYIYLQKLLKKDDLEKSDLYKLFVKISYQILNKDGFEVSCGERSEFRLLQEINDAQKYDILLVDEPESSFDNIFLRSDVNQIIKQISETMPVVVVTHNNTVGASIGADYLIYAKKSADGGEVEYRLYSGYPTDKTLKSPDGNTISNHEISLNSLEAGTEAYDQRRRGYEAIKD